jgi:hypothetical protein
MSVLDRLSARDRRAIALGMLVLLPAFAWILIVRPYREALADARANVEAERALLAREEALLAGGQLTEDAMRTAAMEADRARGRLLAGGSDAVAEAKLTDYLERLAADSRVLLIDLRSAPDSRRRDPVPGDLRPVRLVLEGESDLDGIAELLHRIEEGSILLRIDALMMEPVIERARGNERRRGREEPDRTGVTTFTFTAEAYMAPAGDAPQATASKERTS